MRGVTGITRYYVVALAASVALLALTIFAYLISAAAVERLVRAGNDATATMTAVMIEREFEHWGATVRSHARFPAFASAVAAGDVESVRERLAIVVSEYDRIDRAFVTNLAGLLWVDHPVAPESLQRVFADRDWYRGVSVARGVYVSEVYRRAASPQLSVVAVAIPVIDPLKGVPAGYLVAQVRLSELSSQLARVEVGDGGLVMLLDHSGAVVAHPSLDVDTAIHRLHGTVLAQMSADDAGLHRGEYVDPFSGDTVFATAAVAHVHGHDWTVISQQPVVAAFAATRVLGWQLGGGGALVAALIGGLFWGLGRENARRRKAEATLADINEDLERRVVERTEELRQKEAQLQQAQKMEAVGRLAGGVAHDFNNLLTVMLGCTDTLLERTPVGAPGRHEIVDAHQAAERAAALTRQLLAFSRRQVMHPQVLDLNEVIGGMRGLFDRVLGEDIECIWQLTTELHPVHVDPVQIEQVVLNLVVNARDAMPDGGRLTIVTANADADVTVPVDGVVNAGATYVVLSVADTGIGMDEQTQRQIFEPFFTTKDPGRGTGLGLATVYGIVCQGGGHIRVASEPGGGTIFRIYLPRA